MPRFTTYGCHGLEHWVSLISALKDGRTGSGRLVLLESVADRDDAIGKLGKKIVMIKTIRASYQHLIVTDGPDSKALQSFDAAWPAYKKSLIDISAAMKAGDMKRAQDLYLVDSRTSYAGTADVIEDNLHYNFDKITEVAGANSLIYKLVFVLIPSAIGAAVVLCLALGAMTIRSITRPIGCLVEAMTTLASGNARLVVQG